MCVARLAREGDRALLRVVDAVDHVEHRALARAVRADDRADLVLADVEARRRCSAFTPPKASDTPSTVEDHARRSCGRRASHARLGRVHAAASAPPPAGRSSRRAICEVGAHRCRCGRPRSAPASRRSSVARAAVERVHERRVLLRDEAAAHLARARELAVVRRRAPCAGSGSGGSASRRASGPRRGPRSPSRRTRGSGRSTCGLRREVGVAGVRRGCAARPSCRPPRSRC